MEAHNSCRKFKYTLIASQFGSGKTDWMVMEALIQSWTFPGNEGVFGRKDMPRLKATIGVTFDRLCPEHWIKKRDRQANMVELINGSKIWFMGLDNSKEASEKIKGRNLGWFALDQQEEIAEDLYWALTRRLRRKNSARIGFGVMNRSGHDWNWRVWLKRDVPRPERFNLVECDMEDNIHLPKDYMDQLEDYPERWKRKALGKNWDNPVGLIFDNFRFESDVVDGKKRSGHVLPASALPTIQDYYFHYRSLDHGFANPTACLWFARNPAGHTFLYDMHYRDGMSIDENAKAIKEISNPFLDRRNKYKGNYGCRALGKRDAVEGKTYAQRYADSGLFWSICYTKVGPAIDKLYTMIEKGQFFVIDRPETQPFFDELYNWHWKDLKPQQEGNVNMPEEPVDKDNHAMEAAYNAAIMFGKNAELPEDPQSAQSMRRIKYLEKGGRRDKHWLQ